MAYDYDFIGFTYNGKHSIDDFGVYRTSDGSRYNDNLVPAMTDKTTDVPGGNGQYYFYTTHKNRQFNIPIAFDNLSEPKYREMRGWLDGLAIHDLVFDEAPYKVYSAKVTGTPQLKTLCFEINGERQYRGEGTIQFTCYYPYAHTPNTTKNGKDGRSLENYEVDYYPNVDEWDSTSSLSERHQDGNNPGDIPATFTLVVSSEKEVASGSIFKVGDCEIKIMETCTCFQWDSKTGLVLGTSESDGGKIRPIRYTGKSYGTIPVGGIAQTAIYWFHKDGNNYYRACADGFRYEYDETNENSSGRSRNNSDFKFTLSYNYWYY